MKNELRIPVGPLFSDFTIRVSLTGVRVMTCRLWIGTQLIRLAAFVIGCKSDVDVVNYDEGAR